MGNSPTVCLGRKGREIGGGRGFFFFFFFFIFKMGVCLCLGVFFFSIWRSARLAYWLMLFLRG